MAFQLHFTDLFESPSSARLSRQIDPATTEGPLGERGAVFTRREVAEFILDLAGYTVARPLYQMRLLEPSCGQGSFLLPAVSRLLTAWRVAQYPVAVQTLANAIRAVELHGESLATTRRFLEARLREEGLSAAETAHLLEAWLVEGDFLLAQFDQSFDFVVGNPPYVRQELIPATQLQEYRRRFETIYDRADLYVPFIEKSLSHLGLGGMLGFICTDRWMKNRYGGLLRSLVARCYHLKYHVEIESEAAFERSVLTYPAITVIGRTAPGPTRTARATVVEVGPLGNLAAALTGPVPGAQVTELDGIMQGTGPWILHDSDVVSVVRRLEASYPTLEATGCRVGIGVATGADKVFIRPDNELDVEPERKLPLVMTADIVTGKVLWTGRSVLNPFAEDGTLVSPENFPRFAAYLSRHEAVLRNRHVALRNPSGWYRTIDRIYPPLARQHKLLVPDIKGQAHVVVEEGRFYPHHNLYYVTATQWDLRALQAVLLSGIAQMFISVYSTPMQGGFLRFQAQYLRRIRLPQWSEVPEPSRRRLISASQSSDLVACQAAVAVVYDLTKEEQFVLSGLTFSSPDVSGSRRLPRPNSGGRAGVLGKPPACARETGGLGGSPR